MATVSLAHEQGEVLSFDDTEQLQQREHVLASGVPRPFPAHEPPLVDSSPNDEQQQLRSAREDDDPFADGHATREVQHYAELQDDDDTAADLLELANARLFSGSRTAPRQPVDMYAQASSRENGAPQVQQQQQQQQPQQGTNDLMSPETLASIEAASHSFLRALTGVLSDSFGVATPAALSSSSTADTNATATPTASLSSALGSAGATQVDLASLQLLGALRRHSIAGTSSAVPPDQQQRTTSFSPANVSLDESIREVLNSVRDSLAQSATATGDASEMRTSSRSIVPQILARGGNVTATTAEGSSTSTTTSPREQLQLLSTLATRRSFSRADELTDAVEQLVALRSSSASPANIVAADAESDALVRALAHVVATLERILTLSKRVQARAGASSAISASSSSAAKRRSADQLREVELAERELLWGHVDELLENVGILCRQRADALSARENGQQQQQQTATRMAPMHRRRISLDDGAPVDGEAPPPTYSPAEAHEHGIKHSPKPPSYMGFEDQQHVSADDKGSALATTSHDAIFPQRDRQLSSAHQDKLAMDLEHVSAAIERLYGVAPQLANQRVEPDRRALRERQLAKLGNAIERLSKGRLENQRAARPLPLSGPGGLLDENATEEEAQAAAEARLAAAKDKALDQLISQISRATERTLTDQRVELGAGGKGKATWSDPSVSPEEAARRMHILENTGRGRLASQDASPSPATVRGSLRQLKFADDDDDDALAGNGLTAHEFLRSRGAAEPSSRARSSSLPGEERSSAGPAAGSKLLPSLARRLGNASGSRVAVSVPVSRSNSQHHTAPVAQEIELRSFVEESRNLGTMNVMFWMRGESDRAWTIDRLEAQAVHLSATGRGALSTTHKLDLPSPVDCATIPAITRTGRLHELKLTRADAAAQSTSVTRARPDLEVHLPLTARELTEAKPSSYACATCGERLVDARGVGKYGALPSEHWAELLEAWMCHEDTDEGGSAMLNKARQLKPRDEGEALVGSTYLVFREAVVSKWRKQQGATATRDDANDLLEPIECDSCGALVGHIVSPSRPGDEAAASAPVCLRLAKHAIEPEGALAGKYTTAHIVTAELLERSQAHACHRFVVDDAVSGDMKLLLWFFNPSLKVAYRHVDRAVSGINAVKILYCIVDEGKPDKTAEAFLSNEQSTVEHVEYPKQVITRLTALLRGSTQAYPAERREWASLDVGFLERI